MNVAVKDVQHYDCFLLLDLLRKHIQSGQLKPGQTLPSRGEIRRLYKINCVDWVKVQVQLDNEGLILLEKDGSATVALPRWGRGQRRGRRQGWGQIALVGRPFDYVEKSPYWNEVWRGLEAAAKFDDLELVIVREERQLEKARFAGCIVLPWNLPVPLSALPSPNQVALLAPISGISCVLADEYQGVVMATNHLLALGHTSVSYLHGNTSVALGLRRCGWRDALAEAGIHAPASWSRALKGNSDYGTRFTDAGRVTMKAWLRDGWLQTGCTAILAHNDNVALGVMQALASVGLRVPEDVSVVGFDGLSFCDHVRPRLASVSLPLREIGRQAVQVLVERMENPGAPLCTLALPMTLEPRESAINVADSGSGEALKRFLRLVTG